MKGYFEIASWCRISWKNRCHLKFILLKFSQIELCQTLNQKKIKSKDFFLPFEKFMGIGVVSAIG